MRFMTNGRCAALAILLTVLATGCSQSGGNSKVSGKVVFKNNPVTGGDINFLNREKGVAAMAKIDPSGSFVIAEPMEAGTYAVYVTPPIAEPLPPGTRAKGSQSRPTVPAKSRDPNSSGVTVEITPGDNQLTIELKE